MPAPRPANADEVRAIVEERLRAIEAEPGLQETVSVEWRGQVKALPVISMPIRLLKYNPNTHRVRAQRTLDEERNAELNRDPYSSAGQEYLHYLLMGSPADPTKTDPEFLALKQDLGQHGQTEPGIITRDGVLINGNTRCAALRDLRADNIRVGVLGTDASVDDTESIELSLQLRRVHKREYSFMNFLLAIEEQVALGRSPSDIQRSFRIQSKTYEQARWLLAFIRDAIQRSRIRVDGDRNAVELSLVYFEQHQGKLEELYRAYTKLQRSDPEKAEMLREQRLLALIMNRSKTDLRLVDAGFARAYMPELIKDADGATTTLTIGGIREPVEGPSGVVEELRQRTTEILQASALTVAATAVPVGQVTAAQSKLALLADQLDKALDKAEKQNRIVKRKFGPAERLSDATEDLALALEAVAHARATNDFDADDLDQPLRQLRTRLVQLAQAISRDREAASSTADGLLWLRQSATLSTD